MYTYEFEQLVNGGAEWEEYQALLKAEAENDLYDEEYLAWAVSVDMVDLDAMARYYGQP